MNSAELTLLASSKRAATPFAFDLAARSLRAAEIQNGRIWSAPYVAGDLKTVVAAKQDQLHDIHFYFIAIRNVYRYLRAVVRDPAFAEFQAQLDGLNNRWFRHFGTGREAFEHLDQRLPGELYQERVRPVTAPGASQRKIHYGVSMVRGEFAHGDQTWDIRQETFAALKTDVQGLMDAVRARARVAVDTPAD